MTRPYSFTEARAAAKEAERARAAGQNIETFRIVEVHPYLNREEEWSGLSLGEAALRMDDLCGVGADVVLADFDEDCAGCGGSGLRDAGHFTAASCSDCYGTGKRRDPWEFTDDETGREVTMRREVE